MNDFDPLTHVDIERSAKRAKEEHITVTTEVYGEDGKFYVVEVDPEGTHRVIETDPPEPSDN